MYLVAVTETLFLFLLNSEGTAGGCRARLTQAKTLPRVGGLDSSATSLVVVLSTSESDGWVAVSFPCGRLDDSAYSKSSTTLRAVFEAPVFLFRRVE